jgi:chorismate lyase/3-hydroxybenzoate synthase
VPVIALPLRPQPPAWVADLFAGSGAGPEEVAGPFGVPLLSRCVTKFTLLSAAVGESARSSTALADAVAAAYRSLAHELTRQRRHAVRIWNFVPDIQARADEAGDRYMAFNAGRFAAYCDWFGGPDAFAAALPTSSAVGTTGIGNALWIHVLAADTAGIPIENPRQIPSYHYSRRYGRRPPCFARAMKLDSMLLIGGTASILGEQSRHDADIDAQALETLQNIAALIGSVNTGPTDQPLDALRSLRVHVLDSRHAPAVQSILNELAPDLVNVEFVQASLCRRELLVEIEGTADC